MSEDKTKSAIFMAKLRNCIEPVRNISVRNAYLDRQTYKINGKFAEFYKACKATMYRGCQSSDKASSRVETPLRTHGSIQIVHNQPGVSAQDIININLCKID